MSSRRSIVIEGRVTSLMLEPSFWRFLDELAETEGMTWSDFTRDLLAEIGQAENRAAAIKEWLLNHALGSSGLALNRTHARSASLWQIETPDATTIETRFTSTLVAGRSRGCSLRVDDEECSRFHVALVRVDGCWWAFDLESKNGTRVEGRKIGRARLRSGQWLQLGQSRLCLTETNHSGEGNDG